MRMSDWSSDVCSSDLDQGGGAALGELERGELLVEVAQALRVVHHLRALALHEPQQQGVVDESGIDRRIPAHQHHVTGSRRATDRKSVVSGKSVSVSVDLGGRRIIKKK